MSGINHISPLRQVVKRIEGNDPAVFTAEGYRKRRSEKMKRYNAEASKEYLERKRAVQRDYDKRVQGLVKTLRRQYRRAGDSKEETERKVKGFKEKAAWKQELPLVAADNPLFPKVPRGERKARKFNSASSSCIRSEDDKPARKAPEKRRRLGSG